VEPLLIFRLRIETAPHQTSAANTLSGESSMSKRELIDAILKHNRTAAPEFLAQFTESDLKAYLERMALITGSHYTNQIQATLKPSQQLVFA
jgi:hypothetical protein